MNLTRLRWHKEKFPNAFLEVTLKKENRNCKQICSVTELGSSYVVEVTTIIISFLLIIPSVSMVLYLNNNLSYTV